MAEPISPKIAATTIKTSQLKKTNHQYSDRGARPRIVAYLSKHTFTESDSVIIAIL